MCLQQLNALDYLISVPTWTLWAQTSVTEPISQQPDLPSDLRTQPYLRAGIVLSPWMFSTFSSPISAKDLISFALANKVPLHFIHFCSVNHKLSQSHQIIKSTQSAAGQVFDTLLPKDQSFSQALYTFDIGQNDLTAGYKLNMSTLQVRAYIPDVLAQFSTVIKVPHIPIHSFFLQIQPSLVVIQL